MLKKLIVVGIILILGFLIVRYILGSGLIMYIILSILFMIVMYMLFDVLNDMEKAI